MDIAFVSRIKLPALDDSGKVAIMERLDATETGPRRYRLAHSPGLIEGLAADDEIELVNDDPRGFRLVERGGNLCVWFVFPDEGQNQGTDADHLRTQVEMLGGRVDGVTQRVVVLTIPVAVGFAAIEHWLEEAIVNYPGSMWMYGNVYDPADGITPLNWWN